MPEHRHHFSRPTHRPHHHHEHHSRRHSWPPFRLHIPHLSHPSKPPPKSPPIDEDPFSYFLSPTASPSLDSESYIVDYMSASVGTGTPSTYYGASHSRARSHSPPPTDDEASPSYFHPSPTLTAALKLKDWMQRMEQRYLYWRPARDSPSQPGRKRKAASPPPDVEMHDEKMPVSPPRGRKTLRRSRGSLGGGVRNHSGRPRVWRQPDVTIWPLIEDEQEDEPMGLGIAV